MERALFYSPFEAHFAELLNGLLDYFGPGEQAAWVGQSPKDTVHHRITIKPCVRFISHLIISKPRRSLLIIKYLRSVHSIIAAIASAKVNISRPVKVVNFQLPCSKICAESTSAVRRGHFT